MNVSASAGVAARAQLRAGPRRARRAMVAVRNIQRWNRGEGGHQRGGLSRPYPPHRVMHIIVARQIVERSRRPSRRAQPIDSPRRRVGQKHDAGLRAQLEDVPRAIILFVAPGALVLLDHVLSYSSTRNIAAMPVCSWSPIRNRYT